KAVVGRPVGSRVRRFRLDMMISSEDCASLTRPTLHRERLRSVEQRQVTYMVRTKAPLCQALSDCRSRRGRLVVATLPRRDRPIDRSEEHTSELQSRFDLVCRLLLEKKNPGRDTARAQGEHTVPSGRATEAAALAHDQ